MNRTGQEQWSAREVARLLSLVETERRYYQKMVASLPVGLVVLKDDRSIVSSNRAFRQIAGLPNEDLRGKAIEQIFPSDELIERIRAAHQGGSQEPVLVEAANRTLRIAIVPSRGWDDEGEPETVLMIEEMAGTGATEDPGPVSPSGVPAIVWRADAASLRFLSVEGGVQELTGYAPSLWISNPRFFWGRIHPEDLSKVKSTYQTALEKGGDATAEFRLRASSGEAVWLRETIRVGLEEKIVSGVATRVSLRRQLEEQYLAANRVDAIQGLAARLAHDLNNPLMIINGYAEDLLATFPGQDGRRADMAEILSASRRLTELAGHLLSFARRQWQAPSKVNVGKGLAGMEASLPVTLHSGPSLFAMADPDRLVEALTVVASGVISLTQNPSRLHVSVRMDAIQEHIGLTTLVPGSYVRIDFRAAGSGLAESEYSSTPFESVLPSKDPQSAQTLALARVYAMVREWGGDILATGDRNGAQLSLYLMAAPAEGTPVLPKPPAAAQDTAAEQEALRETILLVEDEAGIRGLVRKILRREHYNVIEASTAEEALTIAMGHPGPIHLLLTDVMMPGMSGTQLAQSVLGAFPNAKVIFMSGYSETPPTQTLPGAFFLQKPFTLTDLIGVVRQAIVSGG